MRYDKNDDHDDDHYHDDRARVGGGDCNDHWDGDFVGDGNNNDGNGVIGNSYTRSTQQIFYPPPSDYATTFQLLKY